MAEYKNYSISSGKGKLYLKEKQPTEGYEEVTYGTDGKKTYHQYHSGIKGVPKFIEVKEIAYDGRTLRFLELTLMDGDISNKVSTALKNKNGYTDEVKALVSALNGLELGEEVTLSTAKSKYTNKAGVEKENLNIYINYTGRLGENGKGLGTGFIPFQDIPKAEKEVDEDDGEVTWNWKPVNKFFTIKIKELEERFKSGATATQTPIAPKSASVVTTKKIEEESDDLPF